MKEDILILSKFEQKFTNAITHKFASGMDKSEFDIVKGIYNKYHENKLNFSLCATCVVELMTRAGNFYFNNRHLIVEQTPAYIQDVKVETVASDELQPPYKQRKNKKRTK